MDSDSCCICKQEYSLDKLTKCDLCVVRYCYPCMLTMITNDLKHPDKDKTICAYCQQDLTLDCGESMKISLKDIKHNGKIKKTFPLIGEVIIDIYRDVVMTQLDDQIITLKTISDGVQNGTIIWPEFDKMYRSRHVENSTHKFEIRDVIHDQNKIFFNLYYGDHFISARPGSKKYRYNDILIEQNHGFECPMNGVTAIHVGTSYHSSNRMLCTECSGPTTSDYEKHCAKSYVHKNWLKKQTTFDY